MEQDWEEICPHCDEEDPTRRNEADVIIDGEIERAADCGNCGGSFIDTGIGLVEP